MSPSLRVKLAYPLAIALGLGLAITILLPIVTLFFSVSIQDLLAGVRDPRFLPALRLSLQSTAITLFIVVLTGTPIAWWLSRSSNRWSRLAHLAVMFPIVIPPAVLGVALLLTFGQSGPFAAWLNAMKLSLPFTTTAVVLAQTVVSAPFFIQSAAAAFARIDPHLIVVAQSLGASDLSIFFRISLPISLPGLLTGACLAWARALGEFGATLLFAGNMPGTTQTLPLAIFSALESKLQLAIVFSVVVVAVASVVLGLSYLLSHRIANHLGLDIAAKP